MVIKFYINKSPDNQLDKTLTDELIIEGTLKSEVDILRPSVVLSGDINTYKNFNYAEIPVFGRTYFTSPPTVLNNEMVRVDMTVDVLSSFKDDIRANKAIIYRQQNNWKKYLDDGFYKLYSNPYITTQVFPQGFSAWSYLLAVAGGI